MIKRCLRALFESAQYVRKAAVVPFQVEGFIRRVIAKNGENPTARRRQRYPYFRVSLVGKGAGRGKNNVEKRKRKRMRNKTFGQRSEAYLTIKQGGRMKVLMKIRSVANIGIALRSLPIA